MNKPVKLAGARSVDDGFAPVGGAELATIDGGDAYGVASYVVAQQTPVKRDHKQIMTRLRELAAMSGERYFYHWEVNNRARGSRDTVEGGTIKLANDLARIYGNCAVDVRVMSQREHWLFYARFVDLETGFTYTRAFQQRRSQDAGMKDADRQADIVFQIGQSKAIRNVVLNALSTYADFAVEEAKNALVSRLDDKEYRERVDRFITECAERFEIAMPRIEAFVGRKRDKWLLKDIAAVFSKLRGIADGMVDAESAFPDEDDVARVQAEHDSKKDRRREAPPRKDAEKAPPKAEAASDPEPVPAESGAEAEGKAPDTGSATPADQKRPDVGGLFT